MRSRVFLLVVIAVVLTSVLTACGSDRDTLTVYSGRSEELIQPLIDRFVAESTVDVEVRYGDSAELAATLIAEGDNSPADVFLAQDPASLGAVARANLFTQLDAALTDQVAARFSDSDRRWVGLSGRARSVVYDTTKIDPSELPASEDAFVEAGWKGRVAIAPTNGSFLAFVAAKILLDGEAATLEWLRGMAANGAPTYPSNSVIVTAVDQGDVDAGMVNHYYLLRLMAEQGDVSAANHFLSGSAGALVMPSGAGILAGSDAGDAATRFIEFLLSPSSQEYFAEETFEYPLAGDVPPNAALPPLDSLMTPDLDLSRLADVLDTATDLVAEAGLL